LVHRLLYVRVGVTDLIDAVFGYPMRGR